MRPISAALLFLAFLSLAGVSFSLTLVSSCMNITSADTYQLNTNLQGVQNPAVAQSRICLYISASNVVLDCMGYNITNNATFGEGIEAVYAAGTAGAPITNVTIRNCGVYGYTDAILATHATNVLFTGNTGRNNSDCAFRFDVDTNDSAIVNNTAYDRAICLYGPTVRINVTNNTCNNTGGASAGYGIMLWGGDDNYTRITNNRFYNLPLTGIGLPYAAYHAVIINNTVSGSGLSCLHAEGVNHTIANNTLSGASDYGIYISSGSTHSSDITITNNTLYGNAEDGIFVTDTTSTTLSRNIVFRNDRGIHIRGSNATLSGDHVYNNTADLVINSTSSSGMSANLTGVIFDSPAGAYVNFTNISLNDSLASGTGYAMYWSSRTSAFSIAGKMLTINASGGAPSIDSISWAWRQDEITVGYREAAFELWKYNGTWSLLNESPDTAGNTLSLSSLSSFSDFAILTTNCPVISSSGTYELMRNSSGAPNSASPLTDAACVKIAAFNVVFDCGGYKITNNGTGGTTYGILLNGSLANVTVRNCNVSGYTYGIYAYQSNLSNFTNNSAYSNSGGFHFDSSSGNNLTNNTAYNNSVGFSLFQSSNNTFANNSAWNNTLYGFFLQSASNNNTFANNSAWNNTDGFHLASSSSNTLSSNRVYSNGEGFLLVSASINSFSSNRAYNNSWYGFFLELSSNGNNFTNDSAYNNSWNGFYLDTASNNTFTNSSAWNNSVYGFLVFSSSSLRLAGGHYYGNGADLYFDESSSANLSRVILDNPLGNFQNFTNLSLNASTGTATRFTINWTRNSSALPVSRTSFAQKFVNISTVSGSPSIDRIAWHWADGELTGYNESRFQLWKYNSSGWTLLNGTPDASGNTLSLSNLASFSDFGILELNDTTAPNVTLNAPANNSSFNHGTVLFNFTATDDIFTTMNCSLYLDGTLNQTNASTANGTLTAFTVNGIVNGTHAWYVACTDGSANNGTGAARNILVDTVAPNVTLDSPANGSTASGTTVTFSFTAMDPYSATMNCTLYLDGAAAQSSGVANNTPTSFIVSGLTQATHTWNVTCTDLANNSASSAQWAFTVPVPSGGGTTPQGKAESLGISVSAVCGGYIITVQNGGVVSDAFVTVLENGAVIAAGYTNASGQIRFDGCGMGVEIRAARSGVEGVTSRRIACASCFECTIDSDCAAGESCSAGKCVPVPCACGTVVDHQCQAYRCCTDADCGGGQRCAAHQCYGCRSDSDCGDDESCDIMGQAAGGTCRKVEPPACGYVKNHTAVEYPCGPEPGCDSCGAGRVCTGRVCVAELRLFAPGTGIVGDAINITVTEGTSVCRNCDIRWTSPSGRAATGRTDATGNLVLPLNEKGQYRIALVKDPAKAVTLNALPRSNPPEEQPVPGILDAAMPYLLWLLVLLLAIIGLVLYKTRGAAGPARGGDEGQHGRKK